MMQGRCFSVYRMIGKKYILKFNESIHSHSSFTKENSVGLYFYPMQKNRDCYFFLDKVEYKESYVIQKR